VYLLSYTCVLCAVLQASLLELPDVMELVSLLDEPDPELLWMVRAEHTSHSTQQS